MKVVDLSKVQMQEAGIIAFGFFDSIHIGHVKVIGDAVRLAKQEGTVSSVFLFRNNIFPLIGVKKYPIYTFEERLSLISDLGVDVVYYVDADQTFLSLSPQDFLLDLQEKLNIKGFTCGVDFTFGKDGNGNVNDLISTIGGVYSISELMMVDGVKVSTERVKTALSDGDLDLVKRLLGRDFVIERKVISGRNDGSKIGFPTINNELFTVPLKQGVYFTKVLSDNILYQAVTNVGGHPTFDDEKVNIETFLLDYKGDLYEKTVKIVFFKYHRVITKFNCIDKLIERIQKDVDLRRKYD